MSRVVTCGNTHVARCCKGNLFQTRKREILSILKNTYVHAVKPRKREILRDYSKDLVIVQQCICTGSAWTILLC
jgi:hypothetical protein